MVLPRRMSPSILSQHPSAPYPQAQTSFAHSQVYMQELLVPERSEGTVRTCGYGEDGR